MKKKIILIALILISIPAVFMTALISFRLVAYHWPTENILIIEGVNNEIETSGEARIQVSVWDDNIHVWNITEKFPLTKKSVFNKYEELYEKLNNEFESDGTIIVSFPGFQPDKVTVYYSYMGFDSWGFDSSKWYVRKAYKKTIELSSGNEITIHGQLGAINPPLIGGFSFPEITNGYRIVAHYPDGQKKEIAFTIKTKPPLFEEAAER